MRVMRVSSWKSGCRRGATKASAGRAGEERVGGWGEGRSDTLALPVPSATAVLWASVRWRLLNAEFVHKMETI